MRSIIGISLFGMIFLSGCVFLDDSFHKKELRSFALLMDDNPALRRDYVGEIRPNRKILISVPNYVDAEKLVPRIEWEGATLEINGSPYFESQKQNFLGPLEYRITGKDSESISYEVAVTIVAPSTSKLLSRLEVGGNAAEYYDHGTFHWTPYHNLAPLTVLEVPYSQYPYGWNYDPSSLRLFAEHTGIRIELDGVAYENDRRVDLTTPRTLTVTAEDLSTSDYVIEAQFALTLRGSLRTKNQDWGYIFYFEKEGTQSWWAENGTELDQASLVVYSESAPYPVKLPDGTTITPDHTTIVDLTGPLTLTMQGPFLSRTATLRVVTQ